MRKESLKIVICIKQVPDTNEVKLDPVTGTLMRQGVPSIINPDDKAGIEAALRIKDEIGAHITVLSMGPPQADFALREALAMGADEAILLSDREFGGADTWATSSTIAAALKKIDFDLIITGRQAIDGDTAQVGPQIAEHLGIPQVSYVRSIKVGDRELLVERQFEDCVHLLEIKMPCLLTALSELNTPRYLTVGGAFDAYREKTVALWTLNEIRDTVDLGNLGLKGSPTKVKKSFTKTARSTGILHDNVSADEAVEIILDKLTERFII